MIEHSVVSVMLCGPRVAHAIEQLEPDRYRSNSNNSISNNSSKNDSSNNNSNNISLIRGVPPFSLHPSIVI